MSFDRFTERARTVLTLAQEEAQRLNHNYIGTEHILLGLVREGEGVAARVLSNLGIELSQIRLRVEQILGHGDYTGTRNIGLAPRAKKVIELAVDEARKFGHHYIGTEHLLLGLLREGEGIAAGVLRFLGVGLEQARSEVAKVLVQTGVPQPGTVWAPRQIVYGRGNTAPDWEFLAIPTAAHDGVPRAEPFTGPAYIPNELPGMRIHHVLELLGRDGWELVGVINPDGEPGRALYLFRRPA